MRAKFNGKIKGGLLYIENRKEFDAYIKIFDGKSVTMSIKEGSKKHDDRSLKQNAYYWGFVIKPLTENGDEPMYWHRYMKILFLMQDITGKPPNIDKIIDEGKFEKIGDLLTTTTLTTVAFEDYCSLIRAWASMNLGIYIPKPNETPYDFLI